MFFPPPDFPTCQLTSKYSLPTQSRQFPPQRNLLWVRVFCITRHLSYYVALLRGICWGERSLCDLGGPTPLDPAPWSCLILSKFIILLARLTDVLSVWSWKCWKTDSFWKVEVFTTIGWIDTMNSETRSIASGIKDLLLLLIFSNFVKLMPAYCWGSRSLLLQ